MLSAALAKSFADRSEHAVRCVYACIQKNRGSITILLKQARQIGDSNPEGLFKPSQGLLKDPSTWDIGSSGSVFGAAGTEDYEATRVAYAVRGPAVFQRLGVTRMTTPTKAMIDPCNHGHHRHYIPLARG